MSLAEDIKSMQEEFMTQVPAEVVELMKSTTERLVSSGIEKKCLKVGDKMPSFSLPNAEGKIVYSNFLLKKGPLVINFYRGGWCPYCNLELHAFQSALAEIKELGAQLVAISPNLPDNSLDSIEKHALEFEVLSDLKNRYASEYGLVFRLAKELQSLYERFESNIPGFNGDDSYEIPIPATYIINTEGIIELAFVNADYTKRLEPSEVIKKLKEIR
jgi:peroxiredoxin